MNHFDAETALVPDPDDPTVFSTHLSDRWSIGDNPNGGYLISPVLRAMQLLSTHADPITVTTHFIRPGTGDAPGVVRANVLRAGRSYTTLEGSLTQQGKTRILVRAIFGTIEETSRSDEVASLGDGGPQLTLDAPAIPSADDCPVRDGAAQGVDLSILSRVEMRIHLDGPGRAETALAPAVMQGWARFADGRPPDALSLPLFADVFPPPIFNRLGAVGWVPTVELTVHVRRKPEPGWLQGRFECTDVTDNRMIEDGLLWDDAGHLVAQSRQVALLRRI